MNICCVIGPVKSGTTLLISLLDSHPDLVLFPMEVKFFTHWLERLSNGQCLYHDLNEFFFKRSKIKLMSRAAVNSADIMNSGRIDFTGFDFDLFESMMQKAEELDSNNVLRREELFRKYIFDIHDCLAVVLGLDSGKTLVSKEGNHGVKHLEDIVKVFPDTNFIVVVRDPRDIYVSLKTIAEKKRQGIASPTFKDSVSPCRFIQENRGKNVTAFTDISNNPDHLDCFFIKYEDLVEDPTREMEKVAEFLNISYLDILVEPTNLGNSWGGNASSLDGFTSIEDSRTEKWKTSLSDSERRLLEYFLHDYLSIWKYKTSPDQSSKGRIIRDIFLTELSAKAFNWRRPIKAIYYLSKSLLVVILAIVSCLTSRRYLGAS